MNQDIKIEPLSPPATVAMPSPWVERAGGNFDTEFPTTINWRTKFEGNWKDRMKYLLENNHATGKDVVFVLGPAKMEIKAHKFILAVSSIEFKNMFDNSDSISTGGIIFSEEDPKAFEFLIRYIYLDQLEDLDKYSIHELLKITRLAEKYQFPNLRSECIKELRTKIESDWKIGLEMLQGEDFIRNYEILDTAINVIASNIEAVFKSSEFLNLPKRSLRAIIESSKLPIKEIKILEAATGWATYQINKKTETSVDVTPLEIRSVLGKVILDIRFPLFTVEEFLCAVTIHNLLDEAHHAKILNYIAIKTYNIGNPEDSQLDTWPYIKEPRAHPPVTLPVEGPPNPPKISEGLSSRKQRSIDATSNLIMPTNLALHGENASQQAIPTCFTLPAIISEVQPVTTARSVNIPNNSLEISQRIRSMPSMIPAIWEGILEWREPPGATPTRISCTVHCKPGAIVDAKNWAEMFRIKFAVALPVSRTKLFSCETTFLVPNSPQSFDFLAAFLSQYRGIVFIPVKNQPGSVMAFTLLYIKEEQRFVGSIPKNQEEFMQEHGNLRLR